EPLDVGTLRVMAFDLKTRSSRPILGGGVRPLFAPTGHLLYGDPDGALMAIGFDPRTLEVAGSPTTLITGVRVSGAATRSIRFAVSGTGTLVYDTGARGPTGRERRLVEVDLSGAERMLPVVGSSLHEPRYSPGDGRWIVYGDGSRISVYDGLSGSNPDFASGFEPKWSPDGAFIYFSVGSSGVQRRRADRSQDAEQLTEPGTVRYVTSVAPDGALATVREQSEDRGWDLRLMRLGPDGVELEDLLVADWDEYTADVSRDGRWVAYAATEEGEQRVYVRSFPEIGEKHAVSSGPGTQPLWAPDGTAIYYIDGARIMAVDVQTEPRFSASTPRLLFENPDYLTLDPDGRDHNWGIHPDGSRFVFAKDVGSAMGDEARAPTSPVYLVTNWFEELRQLTGGDQR
ncbi:MAG TPA: hypothetical protein VLA09_10045, partial [Longimicrobiales bacterium]|nr:hypothetical protein [Longimicrobiales bacterium]